MFPATYNKAKEIIMKYEGFRSKAYKCPANVLTIGYGHTFNVKEGMSISRKSAEMLLETDILQIAESVKKIEAKGMYNFTENEFNALLSFTYNCGVGNLAKLTCNATRSKGEIADKIKEYNKANGKILRGLVNRRNEEWALFVSSTINPVMEEIKLKRFIKEVNGKNIDIGTMLVQSYVNLFMSMYRETKNSNVPEPLEVDGIWGSKTDNAIEWVTERINLTMLL